MSDDWKPGDLALCVRETDRDGFAFPGLRAGAVYTVSDVFDAEYWSPDEGCEDVLGLELSEIRSIGFQRGGDDGFDAACFRKIHPLSIEERNAEIRLLTGKPVKEPAA